MPGLSHHWTQKPLQINQTEANSVKATKQLIFCTSYPHLNQLITCRNSLFLCYIRINLTSTCPNPRAEDEHRQSPTQLRLILYITKLSTGCRSSQQDRERSRVSARSFTWTLNPFKEMNVQMWSTTSSYSEISVCVWFQFKDILLRRRGSKSDRILNQLKWREIILHS